MFSSLHEKMESIPGILQSQRTFFAKGDSHSCSFRRKQLRTLSDVLTRNRQRILDAARKDFRRPETEILTSELLPVFWEIDRASRDLHAWTRPVPQSVANVNRPAHAYSLKRPLGIALIIGPWNYPLGLVLTPLVSSIAAGNCTIIKPSEGAPHISALLRDLMGVFDPGYITILEGGPEKAAAMIRAGVDFIFFTGSKHAGRIIMAQAAQNLTPLVLELGGKNPCIVDKEIDPGVAARRIAWGKFFNAGQTCTAPDYLLVQKTILQPFMSRMKASLEEMYGKTPQYSSSYGRIGNEIHFERLLRLMTTGKILIGGLHSRKDLYIAPTLIGDIPIESPLLTEEIFGPLLPVISYERDNDVIDIVTGRPPSLACYCFTKNKMLIRRIEGRVKTGNLCINGTLHLMITKGMPFGGVGPSGFGRYHGKAGFDAFSYEQAVLRKSWREFSVMYPPYRIAPRWINLFRRILF
jgi:aldehyde dehydrogenase (NAD+)